VRGALCSAARLRADLHFRKHNDMTSIESVRLGAAASSKRGGPSLWKWGAAAGAVAGVAAAAFNALQARKAEAANPPLGKFVEVDGVRLHYVERGEGPVVVLLHGNGTMVEDWIASGVLDALAKTHKVVAFDRPGFGWSERPRTTLWTPAAQARLVAGALGRLGHGGATVVGHSFGTQVALAMALDHPEAVARLVLISGYYYPSFRVDVPFTAPPAVPVVGDAIRYTVSPLLGAALRGPAERHMFAPAPVSQGWRTRFPFEMTLRPWQVRATAADAAIMVPAAATLAARLGELRVPLTVIAGEGDAVVDPQRESVRLAAAVPDSKLLMVPGAGHMVHHSATGQVVDAIRGA
jgi:pimeloyl-ACP methyl ester carboxylesterase